VGVYVRLRASTTDAESHRVDVWRRSWAGIYVQKASRCDPCALCALGSTLTEIGDNDTAAMHSGGWQTRAADELHSNETMHASSMCMPPPADSRECTLDSDASTPPAERKVHERAQIVRTLLAPGGNVHAAIEYILGSADRTCMFANSADSESH
jgi:hypothetical protein